MLCAEIMSSERHGFLTCSRFLTTRDQIKAVFKTRGAVDEAEQLKRIEE
jgi:hypothetical protein